MKSDEARRLCIEAVDCCLDWGGQRGMDKVFAYKLECLMESLESGDLCITTGKRLAALEKSKESLRDFLDASAYMFNLIPEARAVLGAMKNKATPEHWLPDAYGEAKLERDRQQATVYGHYLHTEKTARRTLAELDALHGGKKA